MGGLSNEPIPDPHVPQAKELQIGDHRFEHIMQVAGWPDHHCGDDLVFYTWLKLTKSLTMEL